MRGGDERLGAILDPLDRHAELLRDDRGDVLLAVDVDLGAEAAADFGRDGAHLVLAQAVHRRDHRPQDVRVLRRRPDRHRALARLVVGDDAARLHRVRHQALVHHPLRDDDLGVGERLVDGGVVDACRRRRRRCRSAPAATARLLGKSAWITAGWPVIACSGSTTAGSGSYVDDDGVGGVARQCSDRLATTTATGSPA